MIQKLYLILVKKYFKDNFKIVLIYVIIGFDDVDVRLGCVLIM